MSIPSKNKAFVIAVVDPVFIKTLPYIPEGTEKIYYEGFSLRVPKFQRVEDIASELATTTDPETVDRLELLPVDIFTPNINYAMTFRYEDVHKEAANIQLPGNPRLIIEDTGRLWYPF